MSVETWLLVMWVGYASGGPTIVRLDGKAQCERAATALLEHFGNHWAKRYACIKLKDDD